MNKRTLKLLSLTIVLMTKPVFSSALEEEISNQNITRFYYEGDSLKARVKQGDRFFSIDAYGLSNIVAWEHDDENRRAQPICCALVPVGGRFNQRIDAPFGFLLPYTRLTSKKYSDDLVVGENVNVYRINRWRRPDNTVYRELGEVLYYLRKERTVVEDKSFCDIWYDFEQYFWRMKNRILFGIKTSNPKPDTIETITRIELDGSESILEKNRVLYRS